MTCPEQGHLWKERCQALWVRMQGVTDRLKEVTTAQDRLDKLRLVVMARATHKAWDKMESFVRGGAKTGVFDGSLLVSGRRDKEPMDWGSLQDLIQQTSGAAAEGTETAEEEEMRHERSDGMHIKSERVHGERRHRGAVF